MYVLDGRPGRGAVGAVDFADQFVHLPPQVLIGRHLLARRHRHLHHRNRLAPLGMRAEQPLIGAQPAGDALGIIQPVHAQNDLAVSHRLIEPPGLFKRVGVRLQRLEELLRIDADGVHRAVHRAALVRQRVHVGGNAEYPIHGVQKILQIVERLEAHHVGAQKTPQQGLAAGQDAEKLGRREGRVEEEADFGLGEALAQHFRQQEQVVIVYPDQLVAAHLLGHCIAEQAVDLDVGFPLVVVVDHVRLEEMAQRPQRAVAESVVIALHLLVGEIDGGKTIRVAQPTGQPAAVVSRFVGAAGPAEPEAVARCVGVGERGGQTAGTALDGEIVAVLTDGHRQAIRDNQKPGRRCRAVTLGHDVVLSTNPPCRTGRGGGVHG